MQIFSRKKLLSLEGCTIGDLKAHILKKGLTSEYQNILFLHYTYIVQVQMSCKMTIFDLRKSTAPTVYNLGEVHEEPWWAYLGPGTVRQLGQH